MFSPLASTLECNTRVRNHVGIRVSVWVKECEKGGGHLGREGTFWGLNLTGASVFSEKTVGSANAAKKRQLSKSI
jgi:hypothetical protein